MAFVVKKNATQQFHQERMHRAVSGEQFFFRKEKPRAPYVNVAMQIFPPSNGSNTVSSTKA
jgi:hypothetical protein